MSSRGSASPVRATRSRPWVAIGAGLGAMLLAFVALVAYQVWGSAANTAPMIVIADASGPIAGENVTLSREQFEISNDAGGANTGQYAVTIRVRNDSKDPVAVIPRITGGSPDVPATLTAALTADGAVVRSGPLEGLHLDPFTLDALSTTPVTLELDVDATGIDALFESSSALVLHLSAS